MNAFFIRTCKVFLVSLMFLGCSEWKECGVSQDKDDGKVNVDFLGLYPLLERGQSIGESVFLDTLYSVSVTNNLTEKIRIPIDEDYNICYSSFESFNNGLKSTGITSNIQDLSVPIGSGEQCNFFHKPLIGNFNKIRGDTLVLFFKYYVGDDMKSMMTNPLKFGKNGFKKVKPSKKIKKYILKYREKMNTQ